MVSWRTATPAVRLLLAAAGVHLLGYLAFWGPWNFSVLWGRGTTVLGPIYAVPLVVPVVLAGLPVLRGWLAASRDRAAAGRGRRRARRRSARLGGLSGRGGRPAHRDVLAVAERGRVGGVVRLDVDPPYLGHPVSGLVAGTVLAALSPVPPAGEPLPDLLQLPSAVYRGALLSYARQRQVRLAGPAVPLEVSLVGRPADVLVVERAGRTTACALVGAVPVAVTAVGVTGCDSAPVPRGWPLNTARRCPDTSCLVLAVYRADSSGDLRRRGWRQLAVDTAGRAVALVADGALRESAGRRLAAGHGAPGRAVAGG